MKKYCYIFFLSIFIFQLKGAFNGFDPSMDPFDRLAFVAVYAEETPGEFDHLVELIQQKVVVAHYACGRTSIVTNGAQDHRCLRPRDCFGLEEQRKFYLSNPVCPYCNNFTFDLNKPLIRTFAAHVQFCSGLKSV